MEEEKIEEEPTEEEQEELTETAEEAKTEEIVEEEKEEKVEEAAETAITAEEMPPPAKEEEAKPPLREGKPEEEIVEERIYTIPLGKAWIGPPRKRAPRAMRIIKSFLIKHMKLEKKEEGEEGEAPKRLIISNAVNEKIWSRGIEKPPRKVRVRAAKDKEGNVTVYLAEGD
ncbi:MAG: 50S ribosomal protein L31e [Candidatus Bathycorpusculaceae bacterium]